MFTRRSQAISIAQIARASGLSPRKIKDMVRDMRLDGRPIGSARFDAGQAVAGYFMIENAAEMAEFLRSYRSQAMSELRVIRAMLRRPMPELDALAVQLDLHLGAESALEPERG